jgi:hypothetical protein
MTAQEHIEAAFHDAGERSLLALGLDPKRGLMEQIRVEVDPDCPLDELRLVRDGKVVRIVNAKPPDVRVETSTAPRCPKCGKLLTAGAWPWCPHEPVQPTRFLWNRVK